jgi:selenocysteine lyase/cysteine desulfurase
MLTSAIDPLVAALRTREFSRLDRDGLAYLDYTGSALYGASQLRAHHELLSRGVFGNPHSENEPSRMSGSLIDQARADVLAFFDADPNEYVVCFTANTSGAAKLVAESYPFGPNVALALSADNHNSINGIREYARRAGSRVEYLPLDADLRLDDPVGRLATLGGGLFAYPAQSNFSGVKHPLSLIDRAHELGFEVLLDAAAFAPSNPLSLRRHPADFVAVSFYKILGYPTGVGALVARRASLARLRRPWFAGGTVEYASVQNDLHRLRGLAEGFEDGTPDFLNIAAVPDGLALLRDVGLDRVQCHVSRLTELLLDGLVEAGVELYGPVSCDERGGTVAFNVPGVPYGEVERRARDAGIAVRGGCFCNPGAAEYAFGFDAATARRCMSAPGFTVERFAQCLEGQAVGAVRASVGLANNDTDVLRLVSLIREFSTPAPA